MGRIEELERQVRDLTEGMELATKTLVNHNQLIETLANRLRTHDHGTHSHTAMIGDNYATNLA